MSANKTFPHQRNENPALFAYDFDGVFTKENTHEQVCARAKMVVGFHHNGDPSDWQEYASQAAGIYKIHLESTLEQDPNKILHLYAEMRETLRGHGSRRDNLAIVTFNEFPEVVAAVLDFFAREPGLEYLKDIPIVYGGLFGNGRQLPEEGNRYFRIPQKETRFGDGKNAHIHKAMELVGIANRDRVAYIDDDPRNIIAASHIKHRIQLCPYDDDAHNVIRQTSEVLLRSLNPDRVVKEKSYGDAGYPADPAGVPFGTLEDAGLEEGDLVNFSDDEQETVPSWQERVTGKSAGVGRGH